MDVAAEQNKTKDVKAVMKKPLFFKKMYTHKSINIAAITVNTSGSQRLFDRTPKHTQSAKSSVGGILSISGGNMQSRFVNFSLSMFL